MRWLLFLFCAPAFAQPEPCRCAPFENSADYYAVIVSHNLIGGPGPWLKWACVGQTTPPTLAHCTIAAPWSVIDLRRLGDRIETIRAAADPIAAFKASWKRHVSLPLSDPSLTPLRDAIAADMASKAASAPEQAASAP